MAYDRFLIAPMESGLATDVKAWLIPEDAFARLNNAYINKGIVRKRFGSQLMGMSSATSLLDQLASRLRILVETTNGDGDATGTVSGTAFEVGQMFSIGEEIFTVSVVGAPAVLLTTGASTTHTFNTTTGVFTFEGAAATTKVYFYPAQPVMGLYYYESNNVTSNPLYAFDQQFIYKYTSGYWEREGTTVLKGSNSDFVWATNWSGIDPDDIAMFISNFNATIGTPDAGDDPMYTYKSGSWVEFRPVFSVVANVADGYIQSAKIIVPFKNRLLFFNTIERNVTTTKNSAHVNRCRFSHNGSPFPADVPNDVAAAVSNAWLEVNQIWTIGGTTRKADGAGWIDAPIEEEIMSVGFVKDRLIVYFEASTFELSYTGNEVQPFIWQRINSELGTKALKSSVPFDKAVLSVGNTGIHGCTGVNVAKLNDKVDDLTFEIRKSSNGFKRICGVRDYFSDLVYWSCPSTGAHTDSQTFPDKLIIYNFSKDAWGTADDCITAFGYYDGQDAYDWESTNISWESAIFSWGSGSIQTNFKGVIGGNQQGFTFTCDTEISSNEALMQVTNIEDIGDGVCSVTIINHTLNDGDFLKFIDMTGITFTDADAHNYSVTVVDADTLYIQATFTGAYIGGGRAARISRIDILSKQWNFYIDKGKNFYLAKIDFAVSKTDSGAIVVDYYPSATELSMIESANATNSNLGDNTLETHPFDLYPLEQSQKRLWHPVYFMTEGECVQIRIYLNDEQMSDQSISASDFRLEGLVVSASPTSGRLQ